MPIHTFFVLWITLILKHACLTIAYSPFLVKRSSAFSVGAKASRNKENINLYSMACCYGFKIL